MFPSWVREILWATQQLAAAGGRRLRAMVEAATKAKRASMACASAPKHDSSDDDG